MDFNSLHGPRSKHATCPMALLLMDVHWQNKLRFIVACIIVHGSLEISFSKLYATQVQPSLEN